MDDRAGIRREVAGVTPGDDVEERCRREVLAWVDSGSALCRTRKPATPDPHLVSYLVVVDPNMCRFMAKLAAPTS